MNGLNINTEQICTISIFRKFFHKWFVYRKKKKFLGIVTQREGFYYNLALTPYLIPNDLIIKLHPEALIEGDNVYYKPHVEIRMSNNIMYEKFFETEQLLDEFLQSDYIKNIKLIEK